MRRLIALLATLSLAAGIIASWPAVGLAATACTQLITFYDGDAQTGMSRSYCAEDYPLVRSPATGASFDGNNYFTGTSISVDDRFESARWSSTATPGYKIKLYSSYYFNAGTTLILTRPSVGNNVDIPSSFDNTASSIAGCGTSCSDFPG